MAKYTAEARELIAHCYQTGVSYEAAQQLVWERFGVHMPRGTYDFQRSYLKHRNPAEMGLMDAAPIGDVSRWARRR
jgi:hypothetical protein